MENSVLGNALEGVPEESEEEEQPNNSNIESANNLDGQCKIWISNVFFLLSCFHYLVKMLTGLVE